jgi:hypothetical protein
MIEGYYNFDKFDDNKFNNIFEEITDYMAIDKNIYTFRV